MCLCLPVSRNIIFKCGILKCFCFRNDNNEDPDVPDNVAARYSINTFYSFQFQKIVFLNKHLRLCFLFRIVIAMQ